MATNSILERLELIVHDNAPSPAGVEYTASQMRLQREQFDRLTEQARLAATDAEWSSDDDDDDDDDDDYDDEPELSTRADYDSWEEYYGSPAYLREWEAMDPYERWSYPVPEWDRHPEPESYLYHGRRDYDGFEPWAMLGEGIHYSERRSSGSLHLVSAGGVLVPGDDTGDMEVEEAFAGSLIGHAMAGAINRLFFCLVHDDHPDAPQFVKATGGDGGPRWAFAAETDRARYLEMVAKAAQEVIDEDWDVPEKRDYDSYMAERTMLDLRVPALCAQGLAAMAPETATPEYLAEWEATDPWRRWKMPLPASLRDTPPEHPDYHKAWDDPEAATSFPAGFFNPGPMSESLFIAINRLFGCLHRDNHPDAPKIAVHQRAGQPFLSFATHADFDKMIAIIEAAAAAVTEDNWAPGDLILAGGFEPGAANFDSEVAEKARPLGDQAVVHPAIAALFAEEAKDHATYTQYTDEDGPDGELDYHPACWFNEHNVCGLCEHINDANHLYLLSTANTYHAEVAKVRGEGANLDPGEFLDVKLAPGEFFEYHDDPGTAVPWTGAYGMNFTSTHWRHKELDGFQAPRLLAPELLSMPALARRLPATRLQSTMGAVDTDLLSVWALLDLAWHSYLYDDDYSIESLPPDEWPPATVGAKPELPLVRKVVNGGRREPMHAWELADADQARKLLQLLLDVTKLIFKEALRYRRKELEPAEQDWAATNRIIEWLTPLIIKLSDLEIANAPAARIMELVARTPAQPGLGDIPPLGADGVVLVPDKVDASLR